MTKSALTLWKPCPLRIGYSHRTMTNDERMQRESSLIATIRRKLPDFVKACADDTELVLLHQGAFAADYQENECTLLGMAIKYARLPGKGVRVFGKGLAAGFCLTRCNRERCCSFIGSVKITLLPRLASCLSSCWI